MSKRLVDSNMVKRQPEENGGEASKEVTMIRHVEVPTEKLIRSEDEVQLWGPIFQEVDFNSKLRNTFDLLRASRPTGPVRPEPRASTSSATTPQKSGS